MQVRETKDRKYILAGYSLSALKRAEIGEDRIQGVDYVYTINGWIKGINYVTTIVAIWDTRQDPRKRNK